MRNIRIEGSAPVQGYGDIDGNPFYFRARNEHWCFDLVKQGNDPVKGSACAMRDDTLLFHRCDSYGEHAYAASWMEEAVAKGIVEKCLDEYEAGARGAVDGCKPFEQLTPERQREQIQGMAASMFRPNPFFEAMKKSIKKKRGT